MPSKIGEKSWILAVKMVEAAGFEPATSGVRFQRSPSELRPHFFSALLILAQPNEWSVKMFSPASLTNDGVALVPELESARQKSHSQIAIKSHNRMTKSVTVIPVFSADSRLTEC